MLTSLARRCRPFVAHTAFRIFVTSRVMFDVANLRLTVAIASS